MLKNILASLVLLLISLFLIHLSLSQPITNYVIEGYALDLKGNPISGNITGTIVESGQTNANRVVDGLWKLNFSNIAEDAEFKLGIRVNTSSESGYFYIKKFGTEPLPLQVTCKEQIWRLAGLVLYPERNISGNITVVLGGRINTRAVVDGRFDLSATSCLITGELYELEVEVTGDGLYGHYSTKVVGK